MKGNYNNIFQHSTGWPSTKGGHFTASHVPRKKPFRQIVLKLSFFFYSFVIIIPQRNQKYCEI